MGKLADFSKKIASTPALAAEFEAVLKANNVANDTKLADLSDSVINALLPIAKKAGFDFTLAEIRALNKEEILSDDELEAVAGGKVITPDLCGAIGKSSCNQWVGI